MGFRSLLLVMLLASTVSLAAADMGSGKREGVEYAGRWRVTESGSNTGIGPPLTLLWSQSPGWFSQYHRGGFDEPALRRLVNTPHGLVTLINRTFYLLDQETGRTLWSYSLDDAYHVTDWKLMGEAVVFAARDYTDTKQWAGVRGAIHVALRKPMWMQHLNDPQRYLGGGSPEWVLPLPDNRVIFSTAYADPWYLGPVEVLDAASGELKLSFEKGFRYLDDVVGTWFCRDDTLFVFLHRYQGTAGIYLQAYDVRTGANMGARHVFGDRSVGNLPFAFGVGPESQMVFGYRPIGRREPSTLVAYGLAQHTLKWSLPFGERSGQVDQFFRHIAFEFDGVSSLLATTLPDGYVVAKLEDGAIVREGRVSGYVGWDGFNSILYSPPYLFAGAKRSVDGGMAYDLIALNVMTGKVDWSYELDKESASSHSSAAEIVSFVAANEVLYISRKDGRVMAFRARSRAAK